MAKPDDTLHVYIAGLKAGKLSFRKNRLEFSYDDAWMDGRIRIPLSLSMSPITKTWTGEPISAFLWGLLPDNEQILAKWGQRFQVSPRNPFALMRHVGRDCAGAVQFIPSDEPLDGQADGLEPLTDADIAARLRDLRTDEAAARRPGDTGQFSLAGAQAKTAFHYDEARKLWSIPTGNTPTTHIFKPPMPHLQGHTENEHFCLLLAARLGLNAASSAVREFEDEKAIVVARYDRRNENGRIIRIHQEDMCQALAVQPTRKYENQGGPGIIDISNRVLTASLDTAKDREDFLAANVFNFIIGGTDAHAKNYSMLLGANGEAKLAPLYDVSSILPHLGQGQIDAHIKDVKLAMRIDKVYLLRAIMPRHWERCATASRVSIDTVLRMLRNQIATIPDLASDCANAMRQEKLEHPVIDRLVAEIIRRTAMLAAIYGSEDIAVGAAGARDSVL